MDKVVERSSVSRMPKLLRRRTAALAVAAGTLMGACAADATADDAPGSDASVPATVASNAAPIEPISTEAPPATSEAGVVGGRIGVRRELGLALQPESDIPNNLLPSVEVHDVGQDRMVNFRNIFPADRPVLLWMWAPY